MTHQIVEKAPAPGTPEWQQIITASKIPVILGLVPQWQTPSELWMVMSGMAEPEQLEGDHLIWGHHAEDSLVSWWKHKNPGWRTGAGEIAYTDTSLPFPNMATLDRRAVRGRAYRLIECKTSADAGMWESEETLPGHVHTQVLTQMGISGIHTGDVVSQLGSTVPRIFPVKWEQDLWEGIVSHVHDWHKTLSNEAPPMPPTDLIDALKDQRITHATGKQLEDHVLEPDNPHLQEAIRLQRMIRELEDDLAQEHESLLSIAPGKRITLDGKSITRHTSGRFSEKRVPEEARHLLMDPEVFTSKLDAKKFAKKHPDIAAAATGDDTITINLKEN